VTADDAARADVVGALGEARLLKPAGWDWQNRLWLVLSSGQRIVMAVYPYGDGGDLRLGLRGLRGDVGITGGGAAAVRGLLATATHGACRAHGIVRSVDDLAGPRAFPAATEELRLYGIADGDLSHLRRFTNLRRLDVTGLSHPLSDAALRHIGRCASVEELTAEGVEFPDDSLIPLTSLVALRRLHLRGVRGFTGKGFFTFHASNRRRADTEFVDLRDVRSLSDRGLREIARLGVPELLLAGSGVDVGDEGWRALMSSPRLVRLDVSSWELHARGGTRLTQLAARDDIEELGLERCGLTDRDLEVLAAAKSPLHSVSLRGNEALSREGVAALLARPSLRKIDLRGIDVDALALLRPDVEFVR
jgi:hypothetical protein